MRADNALFADLRVIKNRCPHSDKTPITDRASVDDGAVSNGYVFTDEGRGHFVACVHEGVFLQVRSASYLTMGMTMRTRLVALSGLANFLLLLAGSA
jgi:hypothetical protein